MGKVTISNNYRATLDGEDYEFYAISLRQAWYMTYEHFDDELIDTLVEIDETGAVVQVIKEEEEC